MTDSSVASATSSTSRAKLQSSSQEVWRALQVHNCMCLGFSQEEVWCLARSQGSSSSANTVPSFQGGYRARILALVIVPRSLAKHVRPQHYELVQLRERKRAGKSSKISADRCVDRSLSIIEKRIPQSANYQIR